MKVAVIPTIRDHPWGAPGHCMGELVGALLEAGHEVLWFVAPIDRDHPEVHRLGRLGANVAALPAPEASYVRLRAIRRRVDRLLAPNRPLAEQIEQFQPDHVYVNQGGTWDSLHPELFGSLVSRPGRYTLICHLNRAEPPRPPADLARARRLFSGAAKVFFPSRWTLDIAEVQIASAVPNAERFQYPHRFRFERVLPWPGGSAPRLATVCRLDAFHKGLDLAFEALAAIRSTTSDWHLSIFGIGPDEEYLRELAAHFHIDGNLSFRGFAISVEAVWREHEILVLPSRYEGCAVALTEALGFGRPVVATAVGGAPEWIEDGLNGFLCPSPEAGLLAETLRRALDARYRWKEMGQAAHRAAKQRLDTTPAKVFLTVLQ